MPDLTKKSKPEVMMFFSESCPHCPTMIENLSKILKKGSLSSLKIFNIEHHARYASELGVRSLPWVKIGSFEFEGLQSASELEKWARTENTIEGQSGYLVMLLESGRLQKAVYYLESEPNGLAATIALLANAETNIFVRTGLSAMLEGLEGSEMLANAIKELGSLLSSEKANIRADACFFLGLTHNPDAIRILEPMLRDDDMQVREIADESMAKLGSYQ